MKKFIALALCLILCLSLLPMAAMADEEQITIHAKAPASWSGINIWAWIDGDTDVNIFPSWPGVAMSQNGDWYTMNVPATVTGIVLNTGSGSPQTQDLTIEAGKDVWIVVGEDNKGSVYYSEADAKNPAPAPSPSPSGSTYHVVGSGSIFSSEWTPTDDNLMTKNADGTYSKTYTNVAAGTLGLKVMQDGSIWIPDGMGNETIVEVPAGGSTVVVTFDPATSTISAQITEGSGSSDATTPNAETITIYAKVPGNWESPCVWAWSDGVGDAFSSGWPGEAMTLEGDWYKATAPGWVTGVIINAGGGTIQTADLIVDAGKDIWVVVDTSGVANFYYEEPADLPSGNAPTQPPVTPDPTEPSENEAPKGGISGPVAAVISFVVVAGIGVAVLMVMRSKKLAAAKEEEPAQEEEPASEE